MVGAFALDCNVLGVVDLKGISPGWIELEDNILGVLELEGAVLRAFTFNDNVLYIPESDDNVLRVIEFEGITLGTFSINGDIFGTIAIDSNAPVLCALKLDRVVEELEPDGSLGDMLKSDGVVSLKSVPDPK